MKRLKIYLFRHGQTTFNRDGIFTGHKDPKLTRLGRNQAKIIAQRLKNKKFQVAIETHLSRSKDTLKEVLKFHPECKVVITDDRMIERSYGILEGKSHDEFIDKIGRQIYDLKVLGDAIENLDSAKRRKIERFFGEKEYDAIHRGYKVSVPRGESFADVEKRVKSFIKDLIKFMNGNNVSVAISAHGNSIRLFRKIMERASVDEMSKWFIPYDKVFVYDV